MSAREFKKIARIELPKAEQLPEDIVTGIDPEQPVSRLRWEPHDKDRNGFVATWICPERDMRITVNRAFRGRQIEWVLVRGGSVIKRSPSLQALKEAAATNG